MQPVSNITALGLFIWSLSTSRANTAVKEANEELREGEGDMIMGFGKKGHRRNRQFDHLFMKPAFWISFTFRDIQE